LKHCIAHSLQCRDWGAEGMPGGVRKGAAWGLLKFKLELF